MSLTGCDACTPQSPVILGRISITGIKNNPCLDIDVSVASSGLSTNCKSILLIIDTGCKNIVMHCNFNASVPILITSKSFFLNVIIIPFEKTKHITDVIKSNIIPLKIVNLNAFLSLAYFFAPYANPATG